MLTIERYKVKCLQCGGTYYSIAGQCRCPHCWMKYSDIEILDKVDIEIHLNQLTGEVTAI